MHLSSNIITKRISNDDITTYVYLPSEICVLHSLTFKLVLPINPDSHRIVIFVQSAGSIHLNGHMIRADKGSAFVLAPGAKAQLEFNDTTNVENAVYLIDFNAYCLGKHHSVPELGPYLPYETKITIIQTSRLIDLLTQYQTFARDNLKNQEIIYFKQQTCLHELLILLIDSIQRSDGDFDNKSAVEQTIGYIDQYYYEDITVEQLYKMSGVGRWQYSSLFQTLTGKKPLDYLMNIRLKRAKELLMETEDTLRQIAHQVGFREESYFARKFRQTIGITPRQYAESMRTIKSPSSAVKNRYERVVTVGYALGDIMSLGIKPIGADINIIGKRVIYRDELKDIEDIGLLGEPGKVRSLNPDIIIYSGFRQEWVEQLSQIAPTILIDRYEPTYSRLLKVADIFDKQEQAQVWIDQHKQKAEDMWTLISANTVGRQTATIFALAEGSLYVMGMKGFGLTIYHPLAYQPSIKVKEMIDIKLPFRGIDIEHISEYMADAHFLLVDEFPRSKQEAARIINSPFWKSLGRGQAYVTEAKWNFDDPMTMDQLLAVLPRILQA